MAKLNITLVKSPIGRPEKHRKTVRALGLTKMHKTVTLEASDSVRGMVFQVQHLLKVEEA